MGKQHWYKVYIFLFLGIHMMLEANTCTQSRWLLSVDYLYLKPHIDDTYFVLTGPTSTGPTSSDPYLQGDLLDNPFNYQIATRIGVRHMCGTPDMQDRSGMQLYYTYLHSNKKHVVSGDVLSAAVGSQQLVQQFFQYKGTASARDKLTYDRIDALFVYDGWNCSDFRLSVYGGVECGHIHSQEFYRFMPTGSLGQVYQMAELWGIGPEVGGALDYCLGSFLPCINGNFSVRGALFGSLLVSTTKSALQSRIAGSVVDDLRQDHNCRIISAWLARVGLRYTPQCILRCSTWELGYSFTTYIRALSKMNYLSTVNDGLLHTSYRNFDAQGVYIAANIAF